MGHVLDQAGHRLLVRASRSTDDFVSHVSVSEAGAKPTAPKSIAGILTPIVTVCASITCEYSIIITSCFQPQNPYSYILLSLTPLT